MPLRRPNLLDAFRRVPIDPPAGGVDPASVNAPARDSESERGPLPPAQAAAASARSRPVPPNAPKLAPNPAAHPPRQVPAQPAQAAQGARAPAVASEPRTTPRTAPAHEVSADPPVPLRAPSKERVILLALALSVATLTLVLLLRRDGEVGPDDSSVQASAPAGVDPVAAPNAAPNAPSNAAANAAAATAEPALMPHDAALHDTRNRYTVQLIQYPNDARGLALATDAYHWLVKFGYPVGSPIRLGSGRGIVLCASAKPTTEELVPLRDQLQRLRYPESSKTMPFQTAYIVAIDQVLAR